jgi:hypothetical protein
MAVDFLPLASHETRANAARAEIVVRVRVMGLGMISQATTNCSDRKPIRRLVLFGAVQADVRVAERVESVAQA